MSTRFAMHASRSVLCLIAALGVYPTSSSAGESGAVVTCPVASEVGLFATCMTGPIDSTLPTGCLPIELTGDSRVDLRDAAAFWNGFSTGPVNNQCACPLIVGDGATPFTNTGATDDGPNEPSMCTFFADSRIQADVWFCYTATCNGEVVASLCGGQYDSKMAVYDGCGCPGTEPIVCNDDGCGPGAVDSRVTFQAVAGQQYMIRVGGFEADQGVGTLSIRCGVDPCALANGACFDPHATPGCADPTCCATTCDVDPFCCDVTWDEFCAGAAEGLCTGSFPACVPGAGGCGVDNGTPGCEDVDCCNTVCMQDPFCCVVGWDDICADEATGLCDLTCGGNSGSCFLVNGSPGCDDVTCCQTVCETNPFCCDTTWDSGCVDDANSMCR